MNDANWPRLKELFHKAVALAPVERRAFAESACAGDPELKAGLEALLASHSAMSERATAPMVARPADIAAPAEGPGSVIGPYKLLQLIGEGGFGSVFMAEQDQPVRRRVALKIIKVGMDTRQVVARFEQERQALAMMDHPNIAKVLDAGATQAGRPYFVMELVHGVPITEYCDRAALVPRERLALFADVCRAVHHAHQQGIIHRDIKPGNVLVTLHDGKPVAKVIDFGIAKAIHQRLTEKTLFTEFRQFIGTPEYMSPEQAEMSGLVIDTRADVYSLGAMLYELLTGTTPLESRALRSAAFQEIVRKIREEDPPSPSTRLSTMGDTLPSVAAARHTEPKRLATLVRGELDWIVMKALEKDRARRYGSASDFAADVERFLNGEAVLAAPASAWYKARKVLARHRGPVAAGLALFLALAGGLGASSYMYVRESRALMRATDAEQAQRLLAEQREIARKDEAIQRGRAETQARIARHARDFVYSILMRGSMDTATGKDATVREAIAAAAKELDEGALKDEPEVEGDARLTLSQVYRSLSLLDPARAQAEKAVAIFETLGEDARLPGARAKTQLGAVESDLDRTWDAERSLSAAITSLRALATGGTLTDDTPLREAQSLLAAAYVAQGKLDQAEGMFRELLASCRKSPQAGTAEEADLLRNLAATLARRFDRLEEATRYTREALAIHQRTMGETSREVVEDQETLSSLLRSRGDFEGAEAAARSALAVATRRVNPPHEDIAQAEELLAAVLRDQQHLPEAEEHARRALDARRELYKSPHHALASALDTLAGVALDAGKVDEARRLYSEEIALRDALEGDSVRDASGALTGLAQAFLAGGDPGQSEPAARRALELRRVALPPKHWRIASSAATLARALAGLKRFDNADALCKEAGPILRDDRTAPIRTRVWGLRAIAESYELAGNKPEGERWRAALQSLRAPAPPVGP